MDTKVPVASTRAEIEHLLTLASAKHILIYLGDDKAGIQFEIGSRRIRIILPLPDKHGGEVMAARAPNQHASGYADTIAERERRWEQLCRAKWRALLLVLKAKMEAITIGVATIEDEFLAYTVLPNQQTVGEWAKPQVDEVYATGKMPPMLPGLPDDRGPIAALPAGYEP